MARWSLRRRLSTAVALVVLGVGVTISLIVLLSARQMLEQGIDDALFAARGRPGFEAQLDDSQLQRPPSPPPGSTEFRPVGIVRLDPKGIVLDQLPSGFEDAPDPLVDLASIAAVDLAGADGTYVDLRDVNGGSLRGLITEHRSGAWSIMTQSRESVDDVLRRLLFISALATLGAAGFGTGVAWMMVRRGFRPVDHMIDAAATIASGERNHRLDTTEGTTELGRLGVALDHMMDRLSDAEAEREADADRLRRFVDDASHELRTPVTTIVGYVELYEQGGVVQPAQLERAMSRIGEAGNRAERLIEDLLSLTRLENEISMSSEPVELRGLIEELADDTMVTTGRTVVAQASADVTVSGDRLWLHQALANVLRNAVAHAPADLPITIRLSVEATEAQVAVIDHGPGVAPSEWERVFDRFTRPDQGRSRAQGGAGLGLAIVRGIATQHGGTVAFGETPGGGATVTLSLPQRSAGPTS